MAAEDNSNLDILFEGVGYKKVAKAFQGFGELAEDAVRADHPLRKREDWPKAERDGKRAAATRELPKRFDAFITSSLRFSRTAYAPRSATKWSGTTR